jgi:hypothetical protein
MYGNWVIFITIWYMLLRFGTYLWAFGIMIFSPFCYVVRRKIWQPWSKCFKLGNCKTLEMAINMCLRGTRTAKCSKTRTVQTGDYNLAVGGPSFDCLDTDVSQNRVA